MGYVLLAIVLFTASAVVEQNIDDQARQRELMWCGIAFLIWLIVWAFTI